MNYLKRSACLILLFTTLSCVSKLPVRSNEWRQLFTGNDLAGWDTYIGPPLDSNGKMLTQVPVGLNNDPTAVFAVVEQQGEKLIRISGELWGGLSTQETFKNFHLQLKFKWGALSWGQKRGKKKDSGLLYYAVGKHGADYGAWMRSQEFQIEEGNSGDYWGVAGGIESIRAIKKSEGPYAYDPGGTLTTFSATSAAGRFCQKRGDAEKPSGEWNTLDLYCLGDSSVHVINGVPMMVLVNSRQLEGGQELPLEEGKLQIQSEGAEVFYKDIQIRTINRIPEALLK